MAAALEPNPSSSRYGARVTLGSLLLLLWVAIALAACEGQSDEETNQDDEHAAAARGLRHYEAFQCGSCHSTDWGPVPEQSCAACHDRLEDVALGLRELEHQPTLQRYTEQQIAIAQEHIVHLKDMPSLDGVARLYRPQWLVAYLQSPHDVRPRLEESMPRLRISEEQARDLVAYLAVAPSTSKPLPGAAAALNRGSSESPAASPEGDIERGREGYVALGCGACHAFSGVIGDMPPRGNRGVGRGVLLAPDLAITRQRFRPERLTDYLLDPQKLRPGAAMPRYELTEEQARDLAAFIMKSEQTPLTPQPDPDFLPRLSRGVGYEEVAERVFSRICVHCHGPTTGKRVADGPGNSGGFGFLPRKLDLSSYEGVRAGVLSEGKPQGILRASSPGEEPLLLQVLKARHREERAPVGAEFPALRGMPLGLPALSLQDIQLIESWVAQGAPYRALRHP